MSLAADPRKLTAEEFAALPDDGRRLELVEGEVVEMAPAGGEHGELSALVIGALVGWARPGRHGRVYNADTGYIVRRDPDTVRAADASYITMDRAPHPTPKGYMEVMPDVVLEVASPGDRPREVLQKVGEWLEAGVKVVWLAWPATRRVVVYHAPDDPQVLAEGDVLTDPLLPGFAVRVAELFA